MADSVFFKGWAFYHCAPDWQVYKYNADCCMDCCRSASSLLHTAPAPPGLYGLELCQHKCTHCCGNNSFSCHEQGAAGPSATLFSGPLPLHLVPMPTHQTAAGLECWHCHPKYNDRHTWNHTGCGLEQEVWGDGQTRNHSEQVVIHETKLVVVWNKRFEQTAKHVTTLNRWSYIKPHWL